MVEADTALVLWKLIFPSTKCICTAGNHPVLTGVEQVFYMRCPVLIYLTHVTQQLHMLNGTDKPAAHTGENIGSFSKSCHFRKSQGSKFSRILAGWNFSGYICPANPMVENITCSSPPSWPLAHREASHQSRHSDSHLLGIICSCLTPQASQGAKLLVWSL